jgi:hypothetical protein
MRQPVSAWLNLNGEGITLEYGSHIVFIQQNDGDEFWRRGQLPRIHQS